MSKNIVEIPFDGEAGKRAVLLLAAAQATGNEAAVVKTTGGAFRVPHEVAEEAGLLDAAEDGDSEDQPKPRKRTAKKAAAKSNDNDTQE